MKENKITKFIEDNKVKVAIAGTVIVGIAGLAILKGKSQKNWVTVFFKTCEPSYTYDPDFMRKNFPTEYEKIKDIIEGVFHHEGIVPKHPILVAEMSEETGDIIMNIL